MSLQTRSLTAAIDASSLRTSGAMYLNSVGNYIGVDFATTGAVAASTGAKTYTIGTDRGWEAGMTVIVTPEDSIANITMTGTVTSYSGTTLILNIATVGSDTTTTKTSWRIGYTGARVERTTTPPYTAIGMLSEEQRTQVIRNTEGVGAVVGTIGSGGVLPTEWATVAAGGLSTAVIATGVERGLTYVDLRIFGTTSGTLYQLRFNPANNASHNPGAIFSQSLYTRIVNGNLTNISSVNMTVEENNNGGTVQKTTQNPFTPTSTFTRFFKCTQLTDPTGSSTSRTSCGLALVFANGVAVDVTLRLMGMQYELMRNVTLANTAQAGASTTITLNTGASAVDNFYNGSAIVIRSGTGSGQTKTITGYVGSTKVATVNSAWSVNPDATSVFCVYRTETFEDMATSFVPARTASFQRVVDAFSAADFATFFAGLAPTEGTLYVEATAPLYFDVALSAAARIVTLNNGPSPTEEIRIVKSIGTFVANGSVTTGGVSQGSMNWGTVWGVGETHRAAIAYKNNDLAFCQDGGTVITDTSTPNGMPVVTGLRLGHSFGPTNGQWNGYLRVVRFIPRRLTNAELQALTLGLQ